VVGLYLAEEEEKEKEQGQGQENDQGRDRGPKLDCHRGTGYY
jgi:hypothetical protein